MARRISVEIVGDASQLQRTFGKASASASVFNRDLSHASRGALAGSGAFRSLGRSIAFASGGFLAFATAGSFLRTSITAAQNAGVTQKQMAAQFRASGLSLTSYQGVIEKTTGRLSALAGVNQDELNRSFTTIFRGARNVSKALQDTGLAADIAAARHISLAQASIAVGKAAAGSTTALKRLGIELPKGATGAQAIALAMQRFRGQAAASATEQMKFGAILHNSEVIIGAGLLPTVNQYLARGSEWLKQMNESGRLQKDVAKATHDVGEAVHVAADAFKAATSVIQTVDKVTGGLENTLKDVAAVWLVLKARTALIGWGLIASGEATVGTAAEVAAAKVGVLEASLARLRLLGPIAVAIGVTEFISFAQQQSKHIATQNGPNFSLKGSSNQFSFGGRGGVFGTGTSPLAPGVHGSPLNPFTPNIFGSGSLGLGALAGQKSATKAFAAAAAAAAAAPHSSLLGQFNLLQLKLADAERTNNTILQRSILVSEEKITLQLRDQAKKLKDRTAFAQQAASIEDQIRSLDATGVTAAKKAQDAAAKAAAKAALGGVPMALQLAQAKADAIAAGQNAQSLTARQIRIAKEIRSFEYKAIKSHVLSMQGLIDAWTEIGQINGELASRTSGMAGTYHRVSTHALTAGLGLSRLARVAVEERLAQSAAHRGYIPSGPAAQGQVIHIDTVNVTGVRNIDDLASQLEKHAKRKPRRGQR